MSTLKLDITYNFDFNLIGIVCADRGYKLAWRLNQLLSLHLVCCPEIAMEFSGGERLKLNVFEFHTENDSYQLIRNRGMGYGAGDREQRLLPEVREFDYFLRIDNYTGSIDIAYIEQLVRQLPSVAYCRQLNPEDLRDRENLLF